MFLDQDLKDIQEAKGRLAICCALRRQLVHVEVQELGSGVRRTFSNLNLGLALAEQLFKIWREHKAKPR
jgi:hypothetical protein